MTQEKEIWVPELDMFMTQNEYDNYLDYVDYQRDCLIDEQIIIDF